MVLAIAAIEDMELEQMDAMTAFLNPDIEEEIYMEQPEGFASAGQEHLVCRLCCSLYGHKQSPCNWNQLFDVHLKQLGFVQSNANHCIYTLHAQDLKSVLYLLVYVDNMVLASRSMVQINHIKTELSKKFNMTDIGCFLEWRLPGTAPAVTCGSLRSTISRRLDLAASVDSVGQFMTNPGPGHWQAVKRILHYMSGTLDAVLWEDPSALLRTGKDTLTLTGLAAQTPGAPPLALSQGLPAKSVRTTRAAVCLPGTDIRHHFICKAIANQHVDPEFCPTKDMATNLLTKLLLSPSLQSCVRSWAWESSLLSE
ncbi:DNA-directed DNA polymerase [Powellomyces hirtus]|uniref:DNA-directed DNA polymerase n=1 Tax=Powellomyces hirtus TaxID=109895 RepID=A0A507DT28_9FUNG|nr:DNA-directed DNA polymerase [Powellomyces hirtus]